MVTILLVPFIIVTLIPLSPIAESNGRIFYSNYAVHVHVWVEEPLSPDGARILTIMALESINQTFGYRMNLKSVQSFQNDSIEQYSRGNHSRLYELAHFRSKAIADGHLTVNITFLKGLGPEVETAEGTDHAAGLSDWTDSIKLYYNSTAQLFSLDPTEPLNHTIHNIGTLLHEFGHSFGLKHNVKSIMWTAEEEDNPNNVSNPVLIPWTSEARSIPGELPVNMTPQDCFDLYVRDNVTRQLWYNYSNPKTYFNGSVTGYSQEHHYILHDNNYRNITLVSVMDNYYNTNGHLVRPYSIMFNIFDLGGFNEHWLPEELARC